MTHSAAQSACQQRNSFLPRVLSSSIQSKLAEFHGEAGKRGELLSGASFWIDVKADFIDEFDWIDGSPLAG